MTHILSTRRRLVTPPELIESNRTESNRTGAPRPFTGSAWLLGRSWRRASATPTDLALARALTETALDSLLDTLPQHWAAFAPPDIGGDAERATRLLVGPGGVFALQAQLYDGQIAWVHRHTVLVAGQRSPDSAVAEAAARRVTMLLRGRLPLRAAVQPALVVLGTRARWTTGRSAPGRTMLGKTASKTVPLLGSATLGDWLAARPQVLRPAERMELAAVIDNPLTWGIRPSIAPRSGGAEQPKA